MEQTEGAFSLRKLREGGGFEPPGLNAGAPPPSGPGGPEGRSPGPGGVSPESVDLHHYWGVLKKHRLKIGLITLAVVVSFFFASKLKQVPIYSAGVTLQRSQYGELEAAGFTMFTVAEQLRQEEVVNEAARLLAAIPGEEESEAQRQLRESLRLTHEEAREFARLRREQFEDSLPALRLLALSCQARAAGQEYAFLELSAEFKALPGEPARGLAVPVVRALAEAFIRTSSARDRRSFERRAEMSRQDHARYERERAEINRVFARIVALGYLRLRDQLDRLNQEIGLAERERRRAEEELQRLRETGVTLVMNELAQYHEERYLPPSVVLLREMKRQLIQLRDVEGKTENHPEVARLIRAIAVLEDEVLRGGQVAPRRGGNGTAVSPAGELVRGYLQALERQEGPAPDLPFLRDHQAEVTAVLEQRLTESGEALAAHQKNCDFLAGQRREMLEELDDIQEQARALIVHQGIGPDERGSAIRRVAQNFAGRPPATEQILEVLETERNTLNNLVNETLVRLRRYEQEALLAAEDPDFEIVGRTGERRALGRGFFSLLPMAVFVGLTLGGILAFFLEYRDITVNTPWDIERGLGLQTLGIVPYWREGKEAIIHPDRPKSIISEVYALVRNNIRFAKARDPEKLLAVVSAVAGEGKSQVSANLAISYAMEGATVALIDLDLRRPQGYKIFDFIVRQEVGDGVSDYLEGRVEFEDIVYATTIPGLHLIPSRRRAANPQKALASRRTAELFRKAQQEFDVVIVDTPAVLPIVDTTIFSSMVRAAVLVIGCHGAPLPQIYQAHQRLLHVKTPVIGAILNKATRQYSGSYYDYHYSYRQYYTQTPEQGAVEQPAETEEEGDTL